MVRALKNACRAVSFSVWSWKAFMCCWRVMCCSLMISQRAVTSVVRKAMADEGLVVLM